LNVIVATDVLVGLVEVRSPEAGDIVTETTLAGELLGTKDSPENVQLFAPVRLAIFPPTVIVEPFNATAVEEVMTGVAV